MQLIRISTIFALLAGSSAFAGAPLAIAIHGGAGVIERASMPAAKEKAIREDLEQALMAGYQKLKDGSNSLDAVVVSVLMLENSPHFNAGKGAVFNSEGEHELDAAIMDGRRQRAGAVAGVKRIKNPILLAQAIMERSAHVMMAGEGAEQFAAELGLEWVDTRYFDTPDRREQWEKAKRDELRGGASSFSPTRYFGTVGAVALDRNGAIAAATSTGGMTNKRYGRIGDSPIIGAGTYADAHCAVSATGHGEFFIRSVVAYDVCARARYLRVSVSRAATDVVRKELKALGGEGGVIALDARGKVSMPFNTPGMYRASIDASGRITIAIYADEN